MVPMVIAWWQFHGDSVGRIPWDLHGASFKVSFLGTSMGLSWTLEFPWCFLDVPMVLSWDVGQTS